jgi:hypothetical protein
MKRVLLLLGCSIATFSAFGQGAPVIIRERAKELRDQNNVRQGVPPPTQTPQPNMQNQGTPVPQPSPALQKLKTDLAAISANSSPGAADKGKITQDLLTLAQSSKPSSVAAQKLAEELVGAFAEKSLPATSLARLGQELDALFNPAKFPNAKPDGIYTDIQAIFQENGLKRSRAVTLADAVKVAANEARNGIPK